MRLTLVSLYKDRDRVRVTGIGKERSLALVTQTNAAQKTEGTQGVTKLREGSN